MTCASALHPAAPTSADFPADPHFILLPDIGRLSGRSADFLKSRESPVSYRHVGKGVAIRYPLPRLDRESPPDVRGAGRTSRFRELTRRRPAHSGIPRSYRQAAHGAGLSIVPPKVASRSRGAGGWGARSAPHGSGANAKSRRRPPRSRRGSARRRSARRSSPGPPPKVPDCSPKRGSRSLCIGEALTGGVLSLRKPGRVHLVNLVKVIRPRTPPEKKVHASRQVHRAAFWCCRVALSLQPEIRLLWRIGR